jgi:hypothetical protein
MADKIEMTVMLYWYSEGILRRLPMTCVDQLPQDFISSLVHALALPAAESSGDAIVYELRLDSEQRPALKPEEQLGAQGVRDGSRLYLMTRRRASNNALLRCILQLPDGTEIVLPRNGHELRRGWLLDSVQLHNPEAYQREIERMAKRQSAYNYVANRNAHCVIRVSDKDDWIVATDRSDIWTEYAMDRDFDRVRIDAQIRLHNGMRLRLGGRQGLEIGIMLV